MDPLDFAPVIYDDSDPEPDADLDDEDDDGHLLRAVPPDDGSRPWHDPDGPEPWEQQPGEGPKAYAAFIAYRDMGAQNRSIRSLARQLDKSVTLIGRWSSQHWWQERCRLYDRDVAEAARQAELEAVQDMKRFHANVARQVMNKVAQRIVGNEAAGVAPLDANTLSAADVARLMDAAAKLERASRDEPDRIHSTVEAAEAHAEVAMVMGRPDLVLKLQSIAHELEDEHDGGDAAAEAG